MSKLKDALVNQKQQTEQYNQKISGILGIPINGARTVEVAGRNSYVYVRLRSSQNEVIQAFNNRVSPSYNLPVLVERQGNRYVVIDVDTKRYDNNHNSFSPYLPRHGNTHSFDIESGGGGDIVWVYPRQFMPLLALPSGSVGSSNIIVSPYTLKKENGTWIYVGNTGTASFTPYNPVGSGSVMGLIALDTDSGNPYLLINSGSVFFNLTGSSQVYPYIPTLTNPLHIPIAAIRLVSGTSRLTWDNIYDVRQFVHGHASGSAAGLSSIDVQDEGVPQGAVTTFDFVGSPVSVIVSGSVAQVTVTATSTGSSGSPAFTGTGNSAVLTTSGGSLFTPSWLKWGGSPGAEFVEFGADKVGKESNAGKMGYEAFGSDYFFIIGAASGSASRKTKIFDDLYVDNNLFVNGGQQLLVSRQVTNGDSHDHLGGDGGQVNHTSLLSVGTNTHSDIDAHVANTNNPHSGTVAQIGAMSDTGWMAISDTWTYASADDPVYQIYVTGNATAVAYYKLGNKVKCTNNSTTFYGFIVKIGAYDGGNNRTPIDIYGGTDYDLANSAITNISIGKVKSPDGFTLDPDKWTETASDSSNATKSSPSGSVWYGSTGLTPTGLSMDVPIGCWKVSYKAQVEGTAASATTIGVQSTLSTSPTSETISGITTAHTFASLTGAGQFIVSPEVIVNTTSKTTHYINVLTGATNLATVALRGGRTPTVVKAVCAYL